MDDRMPAVAMPQRSWQRTIDDVAGAGKIAVSRRLPAESVEPFFPPIDIIRRG
jgi:hypothetical protein